MSPKTRTKETRQNAMLSVSCGQVEKDTINAIAEERGYPTTADFLRDAINAFVGEEILIVRYAPNQHTAKRGEA